jgi:exodeoxyribonuclease-5
MDEPRWSVQQDAAIKSVRDWLRDPHGEQVFRLFGYAGTGKTTLAKELANEVRGDVLYATFTGKAALILRGKGCEGASTIHSLIYKAIQCEETGKVSFKLNRKSDLADAALLIIDEVSMVSEELANDLLSFGVRVLVLGDPAQLPPVKGEGFFISAQPNVMLTEVHRQARDNPIIRLSMDIRNGGVLKLGAYGESLVAPREAVARDRMQELVLGTDQLLCGLNRTRMAFNTRVRALKGLAGKRVDWHPANGDRLICLRNNREKQLLNGSLWTVASQRLKADKFGLAVDSLDEPGRFENVSVAVDFFNGTEGEMDWRKRKKSHEFTYGWAITCHKSQGSGWPRVLVFDESKAFREWSRNWLYTAVTRAEESVTVII